MTEHKTLLPEQFQKLDELERNRVFADKQWEHGKIGPMHIEQMVQEYRQGLTQTAYHFQGQTLNEVQGVFVEGSEIQICKTGISPNSPTTAAFIVEAANQTRALLQALETALGKVERAKEALQEIDKSGPEPRHGTEYEHWSDGNFDDSYDYGVEMGEYYAGETAREALKQLEE